MTALRSALSSLADLVAGPVVRSGHQPTLPGPSEPPRAPEGWRPPAGAVNPLTGRLFAAVLVPVVDLDQAVAIPVEARTLDAG